MPDDIDDPKIARAGGVLPGVEPDDGGDPKIARMRAITLQQRGTGSGGTNESRPTPAEQGLAPRDDRPAKRAAKTGRGRSSVEAVRSDPRLTAEVTSGPGYVFVGTPGQNRPRTETKRVIERVGQEWAELHPGGPRMRVGAIGVVYGGPLVRGHDKFGKPLFHKSHQHGIDLDIKLMRKDNREENTPITWLSEDYSQEQTRQLIQLFRSQNVLQVEYIWFNDPELIKEKELGVTKQDGHDNHFHVRLLPPSR